MRTSPLLLNSIFSVCLLSGIAVFSGCDKSTESPDLGSPKIAFGIRSDNFTANLTASSKPAIGVLAASTITWTSGVANIAKFKFEAKKGNTETEIETTKLLNVNLFSLDPPLISAAVDTGTYREIEVKVLLTKSATDAIPLTLKGTYTSASGMEIPVELYVNDDLEIKVEAENVVVDHTKNVQSMVSLHLNQFLAGISASSLDNASKTDGKIVISNNSNSDLYHKIKLNVAKSGDSKFEKHGKDEKGG